MAQSPPAARASHRDQPNEEIAGQEEPRSGRAQPRSKPAPHRTRDGCERIHFPSPKTAATARRISAAIDLSDACARALRRAAWSGSR
jgi:hypothetical protein